MRSALQIASLEALVAAVAVVAPACAAHAAGSASAQFNVTSRFAPSGNCKVEQPTGTVVCSPAPGGGGQLPDNPVPPGPPPPGPGPGPGVGPGPSTGAAPSPVASASSAGYFWRWNPDYGRAGDDTIIWLIDPEGPAAFNQVLGATSSTRIIRLGTRDFLEMTVSW